MPPVFQFNREVVPSPYAGIDMPLDEIDLPGTKCHGWQFDQMQSKNGSNFIAIDQRLKK